MEVEEEGVGRMIVPHPTQIANEELTNLRFPPTDHHPSQRGDQNRSQNRFEAIKHEIPFQGMILKEGRALPLVVVGDRVVVVAAVVVVVATMIVDAVVVVVVAAALVLKGLGTGGGTTTDERVTVVVLKTPESVGTDGGTTIHDRTAGKTTRPVDEEEDILGEGMEDDSLEEGTEGDSLEEGTIARG
jgi:hypothetical protein